MRLALIAAVISVALVPQTPGAEQAPVAAVTGPKIQITFEPGGLVSLVTNGATVREILAEWTRQGGSTFVNSERLSGPPLTLLFTHQTEKEVMASLLRQAAGYMLGPRRAGTVGASSYEVVYILPTSNPTAGGYTPAPAMQYQQQIATTPGSPDDELPPVGRGGPPPPQGPGPATPPGPQPAQEYRQATPSGSGVAVPVVAIPPVTTTPPPAAGRGGNPGTAGS